MKKFKVLFRFMASLKGLLRKKPSREDMPWFELPYDFNVDYIAEFDKSDTTQASSFEEEQRDSRE